MAGGQWQVFWQGQNHSWNSVLLILRRLPVNKVSGDRGNMLAAVYHGPNDLRVEKVPIPTIGKGEILVKVISASICGTDLRIFHGNHRMYLPGTIRIPGHEVVGTIAEVGEE